MKLLNEDFFDDEEIQSSVDVNEEEPDLYSHTLKYFCCFCLDMDLFDLFVKMIHKYLNYSSFIVTIYNCYHYYFLNLHIMEERPLEIISPLINSHKCHLHVPAFHQSNYTHYHMP